jgi:hypothetical protein
MLGFQGDFTYMPAPFNPALVEKITRTPGLPGLAE